MADASAGAPSGVESPVATRLQSQRQPETPTSMPRADDRPSHAVIPQGPSIAVLARLRRRLEELETAFKAVRNGGVDAIIVGDPGDERVYTLVSADRPYRVLVEQMGEGAATISQSGVLLYANQRLADLTDHARHALIGTDIRALVTASDQPILNDLLSAQVGETRRAPMNFEAGGRVVPALASATGLDIEGVLVHCLIAADIVGERERIARDLHDDVIQRLFTAGLAMQTTEHEARSPQVAARIAGHRHELQNVVQRIRATIFDLEAAGEPSGSALRAAITELTRGVPMRTTVSISAGVDSLPAHLAQQAEAVVREGVSNAVRHAKASELIVTVSVDDELSVVVTDNGIGILGKAATRVSGLRNLATRAAEVGGTFSTAPAMNGGTSLLWIAPLRPC